MTFYKQLFNFIEYNMDLRQFKRCGDVGIRYYSILRQLQVRGILREKRKFIFVTGFTLSQISLNQAHNIVCFL